MTNSVAASGKLFEFFFTIFIICYTITASSSIVLYLTNMATSSYLFMTNIFMCLFPLSIFLIPSKLMKELDLGYFIFPVFIYGIALTALFNALYLGGLIINYFIDVNVSIK
jgi:hypothetical protein